MLSCQKLDRQYKEELVQRQRRSRMRLDPRQVQVAGQARLVSIVVFELMSSSVRKQKTGSNLACGLPESAQVKHRTVVVSEVNVVVRSSRICNADAVTGPRLTKVSGYMELRRSRRESRA